MDRSREIGSEALNQIRIVRARALDAIKRIGENDGKVERRSFPANMDEDGYVAPRQERFRDEDADEMVAMLDDFIRASAKFAHRGERR